MQGAARVAGLDGAGHLFDDRAAVQPGLHLHDGDAAFPVAGLDGPLYGGRAAPARQQRGMDIDAALAGRGEDFRGQQQAIGHHQQQVYIPQGAGPECARVFRLQQGQAMLQRALLDRALPDPAVAPGGAIRLGEDPSHRMSPGREHGLQHPPRERGRAGKGQSQPGFVHEACWWRFSSLPIFFLRRCLLRGER